MKHAAALLATCFMVGSTMAPAHAARVDSQIKVSFVGIPIGVMNSTIRADGRSYSFKGKIASYGLARMVTKTRVSFSGSGAVRGDRLIPTKHATIYSQSKKRGEVHLAFASGRLTKMRSVPAVKYKEGTVPVLPGHLKGVLDPASALVFPVKPSQIGDGKAVCNRTLPVFDGKTRVDLKLRYSGQSKGKAKGFSGPVYTCSIRYIPVSGHRPWKKNVKYWAANRAITVTMARVGDSAAYGLFGFDLKTDKGWARGRSTKFRSR